MKPTYVLARRTTIRQGDSTSAVLLHPGVNVFDINFQKVFPTTHFLP